MRTNLVQGDRKRISRKFCHDGAERFFQSPTAPIAVLTVDGLFTATADEITHLGGDCFEVSTIPTVLPDAQPGPYPAQWTITLGTLTCTLPCEPDCIVICEKV